MIGCEEVLFKAIILYILAPRKQEWKQFVSCIKNEHRQSDDLGFIVDGRRSD